MATQIEVDMDGVWETAEAPDWLTTLGVDSCIAVAIAHDASGQAWLIHSPAFGQSDISSLRAMLKDAVASHPAGVELRIWTCGALSDDDCEPEVTRAQAAVKHVVEQLAPAAQANFHWPQGGNVELIYEEGQWRFSLHDLEA